MSKKKQRNRRFRDEILADMPRILAPPPCFSHDEVFFLLGLLENSMPGMNPEGKRLIEKMRRILNRREPTTYTERKKNMSRLRKELRPYE